MARKKKIEMPEPPVTKKVRTDAPEQVVILTDRQIKKLSRSELLEMLIRETRTADRLETELAEANRKLQEREIKIANAGNLAEAALRINNVFEAAQEACAQYTENIARMSEHQEELNAQLEEETRRECARLLRETEAQCGKMLNESEKKVADAERRSREYWEDLYAKLERYRAAHSEVSALLNMDQQKQNVERMMNQPPEDAAEE